MKYQRFDEICVSNVFIFVHIGKRGKLWSSKGGILCCICGQIMGCKRSLRRHLKIHSTGQTRFSCTICHRSYSRKDNMMRHKCAPIKYKRQKQPKSEWAFLEVMSWSFKLIFGSVILQTIRSNVTDVCFLVSVGRVLTSQSETNPENPAARKPVFMCSICGLTSSFKSSMRRHINNHSKARPYKCEVCQKSFKRKDYLKQHAQFCHSNENS